MTPELPQNLVLAVHPMAQGFAWIAYDGPFKPWAWRTVRVHGYRNDRFLSRIRTVLERHQPITLVLEAFEPEVSARSERTARLCRGIVAFAREMGIEVEVIRYSDVQDCFSHVGARTRHEIAEAIVRHTPVLSDYLPSKRRAWERENFHMAIFSAAALVIAHYSQDAHRLLVDLREASSGLP